MEADTINGIDPWVDEEFAPLDSRKGPEIGNGQVDQFQPPQITEPEGAFKNGFVPPSEENQPEPEAKPDEPKVFEYEDGSQVVIEKSPKGWKATLDSGVGKPEVFYGATKDEMFVNLAAGKINATKTIRKFNKEKKLGISEAPVVANTPAPVIPAQPRMLDANDKFEIKQQLAADPDLAMSTWFQKKTGMSVEQLLQIAKDAEQGRAASDTLYAEQVAREFVESHPDFYADPEYANYISIVAYLVKHKLGKQYNRSHHEALSLELVRSGNWTVKTLDEAYQDLLSDGLLEVAPADVDEETEEEPTPRRAAVRTAPTPSDDERIVRTVRRPRAGYGIRSSEATSTRTEETPQSLSAEDLDNLSEAEINQLFTGVRRLKTQSGRR